MLHALKASLTRHWLALVFAGVVGLIIIAPPLLYRFSPDYKGIDFFGTDGESSYIAQTHAIYNGNFGFGSIFLYEGQDQPYVKQQLPAIVNAGLGKLLWLNVADATMVAKFVFPFITFLLVYALAFLLTKRRDVALMGALFVLLSPATTALLDPHSWIPLLRSGVFVGSDPQFLSYSRPISPQVSNLFFFAYLLTLFNLWYGSGEKTQKRRVLLGALAAVLLGCSFYTYLFSFTLLYSMSGCLWLYFLIRRDFQKCIDVTLISIGGLLIGVPYFVDMYQAMHSLYWPDLSVRVGQVFTRHPMLSRVAFGVLALFLLFYRKLDAFGVFTLSLLAGVFLVSNQQILTDRMIPIPEHYHWYYMAPLGGFILIALLFSRLEHVRTLYRNLLTALVIVVCIVTAGMFELWSYHYQKDRFLSLQEYGPGITWLSDHTTKDDVVFANEDAAEQVTIYTPANVYYGSYAGDYLVPTERLRRAFFIYMYLSGVKAADADAYFNDPVNQVAFSERIFGNYYHAKASCYECYPPELNKEFAAEYRDFISHPLLQNFKPYRLTYALWDRKKDPTWNLDKYFGTPVYTDAAVSIYKVVE